MIVGTGTKITAVAVTVAALTWAAAYWAYDVKPADVSKYFSQTAKEEQGTSYDLVGKGSRTPELRVVGHQPHGKDSTEAKSEVPEAKSKALEESNGMLQVSSSLS